MKTKWIKTVGASDEQVNEFNAYAFSDNYTVLHPEGVDQVAGCEHNEEEARALAAYLSNYHGQTYVIRRNTPDQVRAAVAIRGNNPLRNKCRETAIKELIFGGK